MENENYVLPPGKALVIKTVDSDMSSFYDERFVYPERGMVVAQDFNPEPVCGGGIHALYRGVGSYAHLTTTNSAKWVVIEVNQDENLILFKNKHSGLPDKCKFKEGNVVFVGDREAALEFMLVHDPEAKNIPDRVTIMARGIVGVVCEGKVYSLWPGDELTIDVRMDNVTDYYTRAIVDVKNGYATLHAGIDFVTITPSDGKCFYNGRGEVSPLNQSQ